MNQDFLTETERELLNLFRKNSSKGFSRSQYEMLGKIKEKCKTVLRSFEEAKNILCEISK